jgi:hypothetical protein
MKKSREPQKASETRTSVEYVLHVCSGGRTHSTSHPTLEALDEAFWKAVRSTPLPKDLPVYPQAPDGQISAETYGKIGFQGVGKTHANRLVDGRIFHRPVENWHEAEMLLVGEDDPRLKADDIRSRYGALVDKKHLEGLTEAETKELEALGAEIDLQDAPFYEGIIARLSP